MGVPWFRWLLLFIFTFTPGGLTVAQIIIRDTLRIIPGPEPVAASVPASSVTLVFTHNGIVDMTRTRVLTLRNRFCGDFATAQIQGPETTVSVPARGLGVEANMVCRIVQTPSVVRTFVFRLDNEIVDSFSLESDCSVACLFQGHVQSIPLYTSFTLGVDDPFEPFELDHGETAQPFTLTYSSVVCGPTVWHPNCATTVRIVKGTNLGTLIGPDGADIGDAFTGTAVEIRAVRFRADGDQPDGETGEAVVEVSSRGIVSKVTFEVRRTIPSVHHFRLIAEPDSIRHGSVSQLLVTARDAQDAEVGLPGNALVDMFVGAGSEGVGDLGMVVDGIPVMSDRFSGIHYDVAKAGGVVFLANGENPVGRDPLRVPLGVHLQTDPVAGGSGEVTVACMIDPPHYRQGDATWANEHYDSAYRVWNGDTVEVGIRTLGCALSTMAMAMTAFGDTVTPGELNEYKKSEFTDPSDRFSGKSVRWRAMARLLRERLDIQDPVDVDTAFRLEKFIPDLVKCGLVIAKVFNPASVANKPKEEREKARIEGNHWVLVKGWEDGDYSILDPGRGLSKLSEYGRVYRYVVVQKKV